MTTALFALSLLVIFGCAGIVVDGSRTERISGVVVATGAAFVCVGSPCLNGLILLPGALLLAAGAGGAIFSQ